MEGTLVNGLLARYPDVAGVGDDPIRPGIVHRLDAGSSGLLVVARTDEAAAHLIEQFADHSATRRYDAVVWGVPDAPHGIIDAPIGRDRGDPLKMAVVAGGRPARTDYRVVGTYRSPALVSRLECRLETGRTHQIRVHLASIDHPLVGDPTYGQRRPVLGLTRPFLHAAELAFDHPTTGERMTFTSPLAPDLQAWLDAAEP
jgi:23S rRNA pseudouridine1911/1915/1917 synthase